MNQNGRRARRQSKPGPSPEFKVLEKLWAELLTQRQEYTRLCAEVDDLVTEAVSTTDATQLPKHISAISEFNRRAGIALEDFRKRLHDIEAESSVLTKRQREILALIALGQTTQAIAKRLEISFKTAAAHRTHIQVKLNVHNTADMTRAAIRMGLVRL